MEQTTENTSTRQKVDRFFEDYASALLSRDEKALAGMYAVPSLILFPGTSIAVSDQRQSEEFFASAWGQYREPTATRSPCSRQWPGESA
jgi:hypothetical protein